MSGMDSRLWEEAIATTYYLQNRTPHQAKEGQAHIVCGMVTHMRYHTLECSEQPHSHTYNLPREQNLRIGASKEYLLDMGSHME